MNDQELEIKYFIQDLPALEARLKELGARLVQPRTRETNLRFDTPDGSLTSSYRVLRLRRDTEAKFTYKGPGRYEDGVRIRQEIEFTVGDFEAAQAFLKALGYVVSVMYEKYRTSYELDRVEISLDELPYGTFAELEGPDTESIRSLSDKLGLDWDARAEGSYIFLFSRLRETRDLGFRDLSFENFRDLRVSPSDMDLKPADA